MIPARRVRIPNERQDLFRSAVRCHAYANGWKTADIRPTGIHQSEWCNWIRGKSSLGAVKLTLIAKRIGRAPHEIDPAWEDPFAIEEWFKVERDGHGRRVISLRLVVTTPEQEQAMVGMLKTFREVIKRAK